MKLNVELEEAGTADGDGVPTNTYIDLGKSSNSRDAVRPGLAGVASNLPALASTSSICAVMCGTMRLLPRHGQGCTARPAERPFQIPKEHALRVLPTLRYCPTSPQGMPGYIARMVYRSARRSCAQRPSMLMVQQFATVRPIAD